MVFTLSRGGKDEQVNRQEFLRAVPGNIYKICVDIFL